METIENGLNIDLNETGLNQTALNENALNENALKNDLNENVSNETSNNAQQTVIQEEINTTQTATQNKVKLGIIIPPDELTDTNINFISQTLKKKREVTFCSPQFNNQKIEFEVVDVVFVAESTAALLDEVIDQKYEINSKKNHKTSISISIDIGSETTNLVAIQGIEIINSSEKKLGIGINDIFDDVLHKIEEKFGLQSGNLDADYIASSIRYPINVCNTCQRTSEKNGECECGGTYESRNFMIKLGYKAFDISDVINQSVEETIEKIYKFFDIYLDTLFRVRALNKTQLECIYLSGGGAELIGEQLKKRIGILAGDLVEIKKCDRAMWKNLEGLGKAIMLRDKGKEVDFDTYAFIDVGSSVTKSMINIVGSPADAKPIEMITKISHPLAKASFSLKKLNPMADLELDIKNLDGENGLGDGNYFVSQLSNSGSNPTVRNKFIEKFRDDITYVMINSAIAVMLARAKK